MITQSVNCIQEKEGIKRPQLFHEARIYKHLQGGVGIPKLYWVGEEAGLRVMILELLGPSLEDLLFACKKKLSIPTALTIAEQLVNIIYK